MTFPRPASLSFSAMISSGRGEHCLIGLELREMHSTHAEYHRSPLTRSPNRFSRHYYDLFMLAQTDGNDALARLDLLERVVNHKKFFFASAWASYDTARPGEFQLVPAHNRIGDLRSDYKEMKAMIFGAYPEWDQIIKGLAGLERRINNMT
jgi:Nucleotidyl transferase AbiEii toxin, Type IV TA system